MTIREQIIDNLTRRLEAIVAGKKIGSYTCEATPKGVHPWRKVPITPAECPAICLYDTKAIQAEEQPHGFHDYLLTIEITGVVTEKTLASVARGLLADIVNTVYADYTCGGLTMDLNVIDQNLDRVVVGETFVGLNATLVVKYRAPYGRI